MSSRWLFRRAGRKKPPGSVISHTSARVPARRGSFRAAATHNLFSLPGPQREFFSLYFFSHDFKLKTKGAFFFFFFSSCACGTSSVTPRRRAATGARLPLIITRAHFGLLQRTVVPGIQHHYYYNSNVHSGSLHVAFLK